MLSKEERAHVVKLKQWSAESRESLQTVRKSSLGKMLDKLVEGAGAPEVIFDNVDWLIALIDREHHREGVRSLTSAITRHEESVR